MMANEAKKIWMDGTLVDAARDGYEEAILLDANGYVAEGTGENIFLVDRKSVV